MTVCYRKGRESGAKYELKTIRWMIDARIKAGKDATFPRRLYLTWIKDAEFKKADENNRRTGVYGDLTLIDDEKFPRGYIPTDKLPRVDTSPAPDFDDLNFETSKNLPGTVYEEFNDRPTRRHGRPRGGNSRTTEWRRRKEQQAVMI